MQVQAEVDDLEIYTKEDIAKRVKLSVRTVENHVRDPECPLKWTHNAGKKLACDAATLRSYLDWLRIRPASQGR